METTDKKPKPSSARHGIPSSPEELQESEKCWADMEDCFEKLKKSK
jgi:hypothetical protein